jgi:toxin FitB
MNVVDSSGWLEYFADGPNADFFAPVLENPKELLVPVVCIYEVFGAVLRQKGEGPAVQAMALMRQGKVVDIDYELAVMASAYSARFGLGFAASLVVAAAWAHEATIWTKDSGLGGVEGVKSPGES